MSLVVVGTVAFDTIETPFGRADRVLGGSATFFSIAASYFTDPKLVAVIGKDFPEDHINTLKSHGVDLKGLQRTDGETFHWSGKYEGSMNEAHTLDTHLNVLADFSPDLPSSYRQSPYLFLANVDPDLQLSVLNQMNGPELIACDTMNFWIQSKLGSLKKVLSKINILLINEGEVRMLTDEPNIITAAKKTLDLGPETVIVKRGEHGSMMFRSDTIFALPAFPLEKVHDPTGAGDSFAGGFLGSLVKNKDFSELGLRKAMAYGSVIASFNVEDFSLNRLAGLKSQEIEERIKLYHQMTCF